MSDSTAAPARPVQIPARDGFPLAATIIGDEGRARNVVLINGATGAPHRFYGQLAAYLAAEGNILTITYDYRGIGGSRPPRLRGFAAQMRDWAELDAAGVMQWATATYSPASLSIIGHSFGGQLLGLLPEVGSVSRIVTVAAQSGYWGLQPGIERYRVWFYVHVLLPLLARAVGYFPWRRLGGGEDLPGGVALEWARWCRSPAYVLGDQTLAGRGGFARVRAPILAYSFSDDSWGSRPSVDWMMAQYTGAAVTRRHLAPAELGLGSIGHFGLFKPRAKGLWGEILAWLGAA